MTELNFAQLEQVCGAHAPTYIYDENGNIIGIIGCTGPRAPSTAEL
jgi:hypothetical protein